MELGAVFLKNKIDKSLSRTKKDPNTSSQKWKRSYTNTTEIQRVIRNYYEQLYANKMDNLEKMDKFLEMYNLLRPNQEEIKYMNIRIISNEIESVIESLQQKSTTRFITKDFNQMYKEELTILLKLFQKTAEEGMLLNSSYKVSITMITKQYKDAIKKITGQYHWQT